MFSIICRTTVSLVAFLLGVGLSQLTKPIELIPKAATQAREILEIKLKRHGCFNSSDCPIYEVTLRRNGTATYIGYANDEFIGEYTADYPLVDFDRLSEQLKQQGFFDLNTEYCSEALEEKILTEVVTTEGSRVVTACNWRLMPSELRTIDALIDYEPYVVEWEKAETP